MRANIALVTQDTSLLHRSVAENIKYGRPDATDQDMQSAVHKAKAAEFIPQLVDLKGVQVMKHKLVNVVSNCQVVKDNVSLLRVFS